MEAQMTLENNRAKLTASIWQAIAQSGVDLSAVPQEEQEKLVRKIADNVLVSLDQLLDEVATEQLTEVDEEEVDEHAEQILWEGRPFLSLVESYHLTSERIKIRHGLVGRNIENFELIRIQDIDWTQGVSERMFGIGDINIQGQDASNPQITLRNVRDPEAVYESLRRAWLEARKRHGLQFREYM
jgi:hypothetical protein